MKARLSSARLPVSLALGGANTHPVPLTAAPHGRALGGTAHGRTLSGNPHGRSLTGRGS